MNGWEGLTEGREENEGFKPRIRSRGKKRWQKKRTKFRAKSNSDLLRFGHMGVTISGSFARIGSVWFGLVRIGPDWSGLVRIGPVWRDPRVRKTQRQVSNRKWNEHEWIAECFNCEKWRGLPWNGKEGKFSGATMVDQG
jgi:hypothetical protein